ncbi:unnamed protein product [Acanthoscelides obtectus]|uniref:DNA-directed RNA polymerase N-terminal domain-containing protein n=1 Tax=Acanthoscelides obtectus TaxID=200917 RepID=A0A9P0P0T8_ACAOB|nr:unnamed protein product [Acanthoscelides obtectus]CAK1669771.1 DNA-directed RNA polymerase, mitochondrial [Acanthoscelides obtectus]
MHRLLKPSGTPLHHYPGISFSKFSENWNRTMTEKTCLLCKRSSISGSQVRLQSTNVNPIVQAKNPKKRRKIKNYVELLVVRPNATSQQKATIKKLTSSDLKLLASTNLNLSELYKLKELSETPVNTSVEHTYNNLNIIGNIPITNSEPKLEFINLNVDTRSEKIVVCEIPSLTPPEVATTKVKNILPLVEEAIELEEEEELNQSKHRGSLHPAFVEEHIPDVIEAKEDSAAPVKTGETNAKHEKKYWEEITSRTLASYIEVCCHLRNPQRGLNALAFYRARSKRCTTQFPSVNNVKVYNVLLKGFAHKGDFAKIQEVLHIMTEEKVQLNVHSFVAIYECLGRVNFKDNHLREIRKYGKEALAKGITFHKMMNEGTFLNDEREMVLRSMQAYDAKYSTLYDKPIVWYNNHLLNHLNHDAQKDFKEIQYEPNRGLFTPERLKECVDRQIELEREGYVTVESIEARGPVSEEVQRYRTTLDEHYKMWEESALLAFYRDLQTLSAQRSAMNLEPYLRCIPVKYIVAIIVDEAKRIAQGSETYSPTVKMLYQDLGNKVYARYTVLRKQKTGVLDKIIDIHTKYCQQYAALHSKLDVSPDKECLINSRQIWQWAEHNLKDHGATLKMDHQEWVPTTLQFIGKFLYHIIMHDLKVDVNSLRKSQHKNYLPGNINILRTLHNLELQCND